MMKVREKILEASRELFNKEGMKKVSVRSICGKLGISPGSFSYHFRDRDKIVSELYERMLGEMMTIIQAIPNDRASIVYFLESHKQLFGIQNKYRFFYLNLFEILNSHEDIRTTYLQNSQFERHTAKQLLDLYVQKGVLIEDIGAKQFERMVNVGQMLNSFWAIDAEVRKVGNQKEELIYYMNICCGLLEPYLTQSALKEYNAYFEELEQSSKL